MALYYGSNKSTPIIVKTVSGTNVTKLSELENDVGFITNEAIKTTIQSISSTQEEEILNSGTLDGVEVENGKIFACDYGNMKIYSKTETSGSNSGLVWDALGNISLTEMAPHSPAIEPISRTAVITIDGYSSAWVGMIDFAVGTAWERVDDVVSNGFVTGNGSLLSNFPLSDCIHNGVEFIHYGNSYISRSQDGRTWTQEEYPNGSPFMKISGVAVDGNLNYVVSDSTEGKIFHSTDGINFTDTGYKGKVQPPSQGVFIATQDDNHILESHDGLHWNTIDIPMDGMIGAQCIMMNGTYVWIASPSVATQSVYYSTDGGSTWNESLLPFQLNPRLSYCGDKFIILDGSTSRREIVYSYDGINWHTALMDVEDVWYMTYYSYPVCGIAGSHSFETTTSRNWGGSNDSSEQPTYNYSLDTISPNMSDVHLAIDNASYIGVLDTTTVYSYLYNKNEGSICYASEDGEYVLDYTGEIRYYKKGHFYKIATMWGGENSEYYIRYFEDITQDDSQYTRKLDVEHAEQIVLDGTYDGVEVEDGEVFVQHDGKLVEFDKTLNPGGDWGTSSLTGQEYVETRGLYGNGVVCIPAGIYNTVNVSSDRGRTWNYYNGRTIAGYNGTVGGTNYCFNGQQFVGLNNGWLYTSTDGVNWSSKQTNAGDTTAGLAFGNGRYVTISGGVIKYSDDGLNWFAIQDSTSFSGYSLQAFANGKFIAVGSSSVAISEDGENWSIHSKPSGNGRQCAGGNGIFVISDVENWSYGSRNTFFYSTDGGITWNTSYTASSRNWVGLSWCGDRFFAVSHKDNLYTYSFDGINWIEGTMPQWDYWTTVTYVNGDIIVTCGHGTNKPSVAYVSFQPFYEYGLTDLSFNKAEVEENFATSPLSLTVAPTTETKGSIGQMCVDTTNGVAYICVMVDSTTPSYTWKQITNI